MSDWHQDNISRAGMSRRRLLKTGGALAGAAALGGAVGVWGAGRRDAGYAGRRDHRRIFNLFLAWEVNFPGAGQAAADFRDRVHELSGGQIVINYIDSKEIPVGEMAAKLLGGEADGIYSLPDIWQEQIPANLLFSAQPFGPNAVDLQQWLIAGGGSQLWQDLHRSIGMMPMAVGGSAGQMGGWFLDEILSLSDIRGKAVAARGLPAALYRRAGAKTYTYDDTEVFTALQDGRLDGAIFGDPVYDEAFGLYKVATRYFSPGFQAPVQLYQLSLPLTRWEGLSQIDKQILQTAASAEWQQSLTRSHDDNRLAIRRLVREQDVTLREFPESVLEDMARTWQTLSRAMAQEDEDFAQISASMRNFVKQQQPWRDLSANPYEKLRETLFFSEDALLDY